jgi:phosphohistidine phosphatase SixA
MATKTQSTNQHDRGLDEAGARMQEITERLLDSSRRAGEVYLDSYERTAETVADFEERLARATPVEWVSGVLNAQATVTRNLAQAYTSAGRELLAR